VTPFISIARGIGHLADPHAIQHKQDGLAMAQE